ncbi:MAG: Nif3-like dinuclear metal center hexameric protein [Proteobacteria bacterium]|nr:Nif3-like dinuclear metal center hexameric protein [Pseudomonadota bacterium]MBU1640962.1 Nif3-like dinuclear metal center hexameric protein [Pseudomonadota bacterium]
MTESLTVHGLLDFLDGYAPFSLAESWDNVGLMVGNPDAAVSGVLISLDPSFEVFAEAKASGCNTLITHHPLLFHPLKHIITNTVQGRLLRQALLDDLNVIACHSNLDVVPDGVNDALATKIGILETAPLIPRDCATSCGFGRIGMLKKVIAGPQFLQHLRDSLGQPDILVAGNLPEEISRVAVCGGSCGEFGPQAQDGGAQVLITSEVKHSQARWAEDAGFCLIDCGHYATENVVVPILFEKISAFCGETVPVRATATQHRPLHIFTNYL